MKDTAIIRKQARAITPGTHTMMLTVLRMTLVLGLSALGGCGTANHHGRISVLTARPDSVLGGEARFSGELRISNGCLMASSGGSVAIPILDAGVVLQPDASGIIDTRSAMRIPLARTFEAGAAWMRETGRGWSKDDVEDYFGVQLPAYCPTGDIVRLHDIVLVHNNVDRRADPATPR